MFLPISDDTPRFRAPAVTLFLIAACTLIYLFQLTLSPEEALTFARATGVVPWEIRHLQDLVESGHPRDVVPPPLTILSSLFIHGDIFHLLGNMWFLWVFGSKLEGYLGHGRFLAFYFIGGAVAAALQVAVSPESTMPMIGASGAIAGLLGGHAISFPRAHVRCLVFVLFFITFVELPAALLLGLWFLCQFLSAGGGEPGVAWFAHIGGFLVGVVLALWVLPVSRPRRLVYHPAPWRPGLESW